MRTCTIFLYWKRIREPLGFSESASSLEKEMFLIEIIIVEVTKNLQLFCTKHLGLGLNFLVLPVKVFSVCPRALFFSVKACRIGHITCSLEALHVRHLSSSRWWVLYLSHIFFFSFYRKSLGRSSVRSRMSLKSSKAYNSLQKGAIIWDPKPLQVKKIFEALKKGLK